MWSDLKEWYIVSYVFLQWLNVPVNTQICISCATVQPLRHSFTCSFPILCYCKSLWDCNLSTDCPIPFSRNPSWKKLVCYRAWCTFESEDIALSTDIVCLQFFVWHFTISRIISTHECGKHQKSHPKGREGVHNEYSDFLWKMTISRGEK